MHKFLATLMLVAATLSPFISYAALTDSQLQSVVSLLNSYNVDQSTIQDVQRSLSGTVLGATTACPVLTTTLQRGMKDATTNGQVTELQKFLAAYYGLSEQDTVTGYFGVVTQRTVVRFQTEQGLSPVGIVGVQTRAKIASVCGGSTSTTPILKPGPICPAIAFIPIECATGTLAPRYDAKGCQNGWICTATSTPPTVTVTTDTSSPAFALAAAGTSVPLVALRLSATGEAVSVNTITVSLAEGVSSDLENVTLYKDGAPKATAFFVGTGTQAIFTLAAPIVIPKGEYAVFMVQGKLSPIGIGQAVTESGHKVRVEFKALTGTGLTSLTQTATQGGTQSAGVRVVKSFPTVVLGALPSTGAEDGRLMRFAINANTSGTLGVKDIFINIGSQDVSISSVQLYGYVDASYSTPVSGFTAAGLLGSGDMTGVPGKDFRFVLPSTLQIPAGTTRYFEVRGAVQPTGPNGFIRTTLVGDQYLYPVETYSSLQAKSFFMWTPNSVTTSALTDADWTNGYGVTGLPAVGLNSVRTTTSTTTLPTPTVSFTANPTSIVPGQSSTLSWASSGTLNGGCYIFDGSGGASIIPFSTTSGSGNISVSPTVTTTYTLWCTSNWKDGSPTAEKKATVTVTPPPPPPPTGSAAVTSWKAYTFATKKAAPCSGSRYVGYSQKYGVWVGAVLCGSSTTYKLYMSSTETGTYLQIADYAGHGQDQCELVNPTFTLPNEDDITSGTCKNCAIGGVVDVQDEQVYARSRLGELFTSVTSRFWADLTTNSYSCGVSIAPTVTVPGPITPVPLTPPTPSGAIEQ